MKQFDHNIQVVKIRGEVATVVCRCGTCFKLFQRNVPADQPVETEECHACKSGRRRPTETLRAGS